MNFFSGIFCLVGFVAGGSAPTPAVDDTMTHVSRSAEQELAKSIEELNRLRAEISRDKLPIAQEFTALEEMLSQLRRDHDRVSRVVDSGDLESSTIKARMKVRQDELAYVAGLLDEYARTFESKVNVSELQYCGEAIERTKQLNENTTLSPSEKFKQQTEFTEMTVKRLFDSIGGLRFPGVGVDLTGGVANGQFAIIGPVALFRGEGGGATGLVVPQTGSTKPLIRPLEGTLQAGIASLVDTGSGLLPLDPSRGGALKALVQKTNIIHIFQKGGPIMWPLLVASILALGTVLERVIFLMREKIKRDPKALDAFFAALTRGDMQGAIEISKRTKFYIVRALGYAVAHKEQSLANALFYSQGQELKRFQRGIPVLDTVITLAPLLGLLGTVTGMMGSFQLIGGDLGAPGAITGGIAEALIATAFGLGIAIVSLIPFNFLNARIEEARHEIEAAATQLELLIQPQAALAAAPTQSFQVGMEKEHRADAELMAAREESLRQEREIRRKRDVLERKMAELRSELDEEELRIKVLPHRERVAQADHVRSQSTKE